MKKLILNLEGAKELTKKEMKNVDGGASNCGPGFRYWRGCGCIPNHLLCKAVPDDTNVQ
jgi:bacteriocin-like protein